ncbi:MAG: hypothetical protein KY475_13485 [Planctomycetes bacterium]|nr:hypothetical protein [Planctomycetota bacterium]
MSFEKDLLGAMEGRITWVTWMEPPARVNAQSNLIGIKLNDADAFRDTLQTLMAPAKERLEEKSFGGASYYLAPSPDRDDNAQSRPLVRQPTPSFGIVGDYLLLADSEKLFQQAVRCKSDPGRSLAGELDYKLIASKISRQPGGDSPGLITFRRPEEGMRNLYELAAGQQTRDILGQRADRNRAFGALHQALQDNPLPPFAVVQKYLAPGGAMLVSDATGFHYTGFSLKRE